MCLTLGELNMSTEKLVVFFSLPLFRALLCFEVVCTEEVSNTGSGTRLLSVQTHLHSIFQTFCLCSAFCVNVQHAPSFHFCFLFFSQNKKNKPDKVWRQRRCWVLQRAFPAKIVTSFFWSCSAWQPVNSHFFNQSPENTIFCLNYPNPLNYSNPL